MSKKDRLGSDPLGFMGDEGDSHPDSNIENSETPGGEKPAEEKTAKKQEGADKKKRSSSKTLTTSVKATGKKQGVKESDMENKNEVISKNLKINYNEKNPGTVKIDFDGEMTIYSIEDIKESIVNGLSGSDKLELDLSRVSRIDSSAFQLFLMARMEAAGSEKEINLLSPSDEVKRIFNLYGESI